MIKISRMAMGSQFEIVTDSIPNIEQILSDAFYRLEWLEQQLSHFDVDSHISTINRYSFEQPVKLAPLLFDTLLTIRSWSELTENAFDPMVGKLIKEWGFFQRGSGSETFAPAPDPNKLKILAAQSGWKNVIMNETDSTIHFKTPEVELHLGAVGKGLAVQMIASCLRENSVTSVLISGGGSSIVALGSSPDSNGWKIGLEHPMNSDIIFGTATISFKSLSVSSAMGQTRSDGIRTFGHILDPRTGESLQSHDSVVVSAENAGYGEALSTAFLIQGEMWTREFIREHPDVGCAFFHTDECRTTVLNFPEFEPL